MAAVKAARIGSHHTHFHRARADEHKVQSRLQRCSVDLSVPVGSVSKSIHCSENGDIGTATPSLFALGQDRCHANVCGTARLDATWGGGVEQPRPNGMSTSLGGFMRWMQHARRVGPTQTSSGRGWCDPPHSGVSMVDGRDAMRPGLGTADKSAEWQKALKDRVHTLASASRRFRPTMDALPDLMRGAESEGLTLSSILDLQPRLASEQRRP